MTFKDLGIIDPLLSAIGDKNYINPSPIQEKSIPLILQGYDILASAQTGTGKTAGFALPMIQNLISGNGSNHKKIKANHFAVTVNNLEIFMEYLKSNDIYFESWDGNELQYNIRPHDNALQIYLTDPEGNWIEVNQRQ